MGIENDLTRIAAALEGIAAAVAVLVNVPKAEAPTATKTEQSKAKAKPAEPKPEPVLSKPDPEPKPDKPTKDLETEHTSDIAYEDIRKSFFELLGVIRDTVDMATAKEEGVKLLRAYTGGSPLTDKSLPPENYPAIWKAIKDKEIEYSVGQ